MTRTKGRGGGRDLERDLFAHVTEYFSDWAVVQANVLIDLEGLALFAARPRSRRFVSRNRIRVGEISPMLRRYQRSRTRRRRDVSSCCSLSERVWRIRLILGMAL